MRRSSYNDAGRLVNVVIMVRAVMALSIIVRMLRGFSGGGGFTMVVVMLGVFLIMKKEAAGLTVATTDVCRKRGQNWAYAK